MLHLQAGLMSVNGDQSYRHVMLPCTAHLQRPACSRLLHACTPEQNHTEGWQSVYGDSLLSHRVSADVQWKVTEIGTRCDRAYHWWQQWRAQGRHEMQSCAAPQQHPAAA